MDFATIERARLSAGLTPTAMCRLAGVGGYNYWRARAGSVQPSLTTLRKWHDAVTGKPAKAPPSDVTAVSVQSAYRAHLAYIAKEMGFDPGEVADKPNSRAFWKARALALSSVAADLGLRQAELARALGLSKQILHWNIKQAISLQDDPALRWFFEAAVSPAKEG